MWEAGQEERTNISRSISEHHNKIQAEKRHHKQYEKE
jgi:hypothetical protein